MMTADRRVMDFNGRYLIEIKYRRENGAWTLIKEAIDGRIREKNPLAISHVLTDLSIACSCKSTSSPEQIQSRLDAVPGKHVSLLLDAIEEAGFSGTASYTRVPVEPIEGSIYEATIIVEKQKKRYHLG